MKKIFTLGMICALFLVKANAQCTPDFANTTLGLSPLGDAIPCAVQGTAYAQTIQIYAPNSVTVSGIPVTINSIRIDSIGNLPCGIGYGFDRTDKTYTATPSTPLRGCMQIAGTTTDPVGQYKLKVSVTLNTSLISGSYPDASLIPGLGSAFSIFFRVQTAGTCAPIDTLPTATNQTASCSTRDFTNINTVTSAFTSFEIAPNPVTDQSIVSFSADNSGEYESIITNTIGEIMYSEKVNVVEGDNHFNLNTKNLTNGVYFFTIRDGKSAITKKFILSK